MVTLLQYGATEKRIGTMLFAAVVVKDWIEKREADAESPVSQELHDAFVLFLAASMTEGRDTIEQDYEATRRMMQGALGRRGTKRSPDLQQWLAQLGVRFREPPYLPPLAPLVAEAFQFHEHT